MLVLKAYRLTGEAPEMLGAFESLLTSVGDDYVPVTVNARRVQAEILGMDIELLQTISSPDVSVGLQYGVEVGELFSREKNLFGVLVSVETRRISSEETVARSVVRLFGLGDSGSLPDAFEEFFEIAKKEFDGQWNQLPLKSDRTRSLQAEGLTPVGEIDGGLISASHVLENASFRAAAITIKSSRGILARDLEKNLAGIYTGDHGRLKNALLESEVITSETVLICRSSGDLVNRIASPEAVGNLAGLGIKCSCGTPLEEEEIHESITVTPRGHELLDKNQWMTLVLIDELKRIGVSESDIYVEQQFGGDEIDCIAVISGDTVLFELKDKEFSLGHAYSFNAKVGIFRPDLSVIVTTGQVGNDAKDHFLRAKRAVTAGRRSGPRRDDAEEPILIEGISNLRGQLEEIGTKLVGRDARRQLRDLLLGAALSPAAVVEAMAGPAAED